MVTAREVLALVITGDGKGAITEMERVGVAAKRNLDGTEKSLANLGNKATSFGIGATAAGLVASVGLFAAAKGAGQLDTDIRRIEGSLGSASGEALRFVENANGIGLSDQAAASYTAQIGELAVGLKLGQQEAAGFTTKSVDLISQLSLIKGLDPSAGLYALQSGLIGEYDALQRLVPTISAASIENRALADSGKESAKQLTSAEKAAATFNIVIDSATDTLARSGGVQDSLAVRNARLAATWGDIKTSLGEGALPVMEAATGTAENLLGAFGAADEVTGGWLSRLATFAAVGTLASGGVAVLVGQGIKAKEMVSDLNVGLRDADGNMSRTGKGAVVLGGALTALAITDVAFDWINEGTGRAREMTDAINELKIAIAAGREVEGFQAFADLVGAEQNTLRLQNLWQEFGAEVDLVGTGVKADVEQVQRAFDELGKSDPKAATGALDALEDATSRLDPNSRQWKINTEFIQRNRESLRLAAGAQKAAAGTTDDATRSNLALATSLDRAAYSYDKTSDAAQGGKPGALAYADAIRGALDPVLGLADANAKLVEAQKNLAKVADTNGRDVRDAQRGVADAYRGVEGAVRGVADAERALQDSRRAVGDATRNLEDAQRDLNEVLNDDPLFGLQQVSPEQQLADARNRLADANRRLAANPADGQALTDRDEALADLERANDRKQQMLRDGESRTREVEDAHRRVEDAQRGLQDAHRGVADAERAVVDAQRAVQDARIAVSDAKAALAEVQSQHGLDSEAYAAAAREVVRASLDVQDADARLAQWLRDNGIAAVADLNAEFDRMIAQGGPVGEAAAVMKAQLADLVGQAEAYGNSLNIDDEVAGMQTVLEKWFGWTTGHPPATAHVDANTNPANDKVKLWQWVTNQATAVVTVEGRLGPSWDSTFDKISERYRASQTQAPSRGIDPNANGGVDRNYWTPYHSGGRIEDAPFGVEVPIMALGHEGVVNHRGMRVLGPDGLAEINAGRLPTRRVPSSRLPQMRSAASESAAGVREVQERLTIKAPIQVVSPDPDRAGEAVMGRLERLAWESGKGLRPGKPLG